MLQNNHTAAEKTQFMPVGARVLLNRLLLQLSHAELSFISVDVVCIDLSFGVGCLFLPHALFIQLIPFSVFPDKVWGIIFLGIGSLGLFGVRKKKFWGTAVFCFGSAFLFATIACSLALNGAYATASTYLVIALNAARQSAKLVELLPCAPRQVS